ncbi:MAG TPA: nucleotidyltransferase family protein [Bacteroidales bacterium]
MKAMIFAAGIGYRLRPLTDGMPKALVPIGGQPMLGRLIHRLSKQGISSFIVNVHHFSAQVVDYLNTKEFKDFKISISDESGKLLDTGGGLFKAAGFFSDGAPFLVYNVDVLSDIDVNQMLEHHHAEGNLATLAVSRRNSSRLLLLDGQNYLKGWQNAKTSEVVRVTGAVGKLTPMAFSGIHIIDPAIFAFSRKTKPFPIIELYLRLAENYRIGVYIHEPYNWADMGSPDGLKMAEQLLPIIDPAACN